MNAYSRLTCCCCCVPTKYKFKGERLAVRRAPEPSNIKFENLGVPAPKRNFFRCQSLWITVLIVLVSTLVNFTASLYRAQLSSFESEECVNITSSLFANITYVLAVHVIISRHPHPCLPISDVVTDFFIVPERWFQVPWRLWTIIQNMMMSSSVIVNGVFQSICWRAWSAQKPS